MFERAHFAARNPIGGAFVFTRASDNHSMNRVYEINEYREFVAKTFRSAVTVRYWGTLETKYLSTRFRISKTR